jgi:hypothetical protein
MKLQGTLPKGDANGLEAIASALVARPRGLHVVIAVVDVKKITTDSDDGSAEPTVRIRRVEVIPPDDKEAAEKLMRRALERRQGDTVLPLEVEDELTMLFENIDPDTGELLTADDDDDDTGDVD